MSTASKRRVVLDDIAREAGVHRSTVSLSLRNHASIPLSTRLRLQDIARALGYRPDPLLSSFNAQTVKRRRGTLARTLAFVHDLEGRESFNASQRHQDLFHGAAERAAESASRFEVFSLAKDGLSPARLNQILEARSISGVLLAALNPALPFPYLPCRTYTALSMDTIHPSALVDSLVPNLREIARHAVLELRRLGSKNPVILLGAEVSEDARHALHAGALGAAGGVSRVEVMVYPGEVPTRSGRGSTTRRPWDGLVLCGLHEKVLERPLLGLPSVRIDFLDTGSKLPGVPSWHRVLGGAAFDLLLERISLNDAGLPRCPVSLQYPLAWHSTAKSCASPQD